jgi:hypothetical protein
MRVGEMRLKHPANLPQAFSHFYNYIVEDQGLIDPAFTFFNEANICLDQPTRLG